MRVVVITPPNPVVTWPEAKAHLRLDDDGEQSEVVGMVAAATAHIDGPDGWLGRSIGSQTLEARFDLGWDIRPLRLPCGPVIEMLSVRYLDNSGVEQAADVADFELFGDELEPVATTFPWYGVRRHREGCRIQYRAGYGTLPPPIRAAILLMVGDLHRFRATASDMNINATAIPMSLTVERMLQPYRVYR